VSHARWLLEAYDNGYFIIGPQSTYKYSWIIKTDINGEISWDKKVGDGQYQFILGVIDQTLDGGFVVTGQSNLSALSGGVYMISAKLNGEEKGKAKALKFN